MVSTVAKPEIKVPVKETLLTPRFYTTDFETAANLDISSQKPELEVMLAEMRADYNRRHFVRDQEFEQSWAHINEETRRAFIDFLERSCTSEFSGFLLFKELSRRLKTKNPILAEIFQLMARDEARHAGFLNQAMKDFRLGLDLGDMTKNRSYTFFKLDWVIYTVYLSEKIGYWRYITIFRHLEKHPENCYYPLFRYFENWCQDENRHGDIFKALLRSQPELWDNWKAKLWIRFFLLTVFVTHSLTVYERADFYHSLGLDPQTYDQTVITNTNETAARAFSVILDTEHPQFFPRLQRCAEANLKILAIDQSRQNPLLKFLRKLPLFANIAVNFCLLYLIKPIEVEALRQEVR